MRVLFEKAGRIVRTAVSLPDTNQRHDTPCRSCPCPGGCAYCNVAKVLCAQPENQYLPPETRLEERNWEQILLLPPAHGTEMLRPPRV